MNKVYLHGGLGKRFGKTWHVAANNSQEVVQAIDANADGFVGYIVKQSLEGNEHYLLAKDPKQIKTQEELIDNMVDPQKLSKEIHIVPSIYGGFIAGFLGKFVIAKVAGAMSAAIWGAVAQLAISALMKTPEDKVQTRGENVSTKSFLLGASRESASQGGSIPLGYGRAFVGPNLIGQSMKTTKIKSDYLESSTELTFTHLISEGPIEGPVNEYGKNVDAWETDTNNQIKPSKEVQRALYINENQLLKGEFYNYNLNEEDALPVLNIDPKESKILSNYSSFIYTYGQELFGASPYFSSDNTARTTPVLTIEEALKEATIFSHKISNIDTSQVILNIRASIFETVQETGNNRADEVFFAVFVVQDNGTRVNVLDAPEFCSVRMDASGVLTDQDGNFLGVSKTGSNSFKINGVATSAYQFELAINFKKEFKSKTPTIQIVKLSKELDTAAASNVFTQWQTTKKRLFSKKVNTHKKTDWNSVGGQGRSRSLIIANIEERIYAQLLYPNCVTSSIKIDSLNFSNQPTFMWHLKLKKVLIPSNYDPVARKYYGPWNGLFKGQTSVAESIYSIPDSQKRWTDNPAWVFYDLVSNPTYGCGKYGVEEFDIDKWQLYKIAKYCDELVETSYSIQTASGLPYSFEYQDTGNLTAVEGEKYFSITIDEKHYYKQSGGLISQELTNESFQKYYEFNSPGNYSLTVPEGVRSVTAFVVGGGGSGERIGFNAPSINFANKDTLLYTNVNGLNGQASSLSSSGGLNIVAHGGLGGGRNDYANSGKNTINGASKVNSQILGFASNGRGGASRISSSDNFAIAGAKGSNFGPKGSSSLKPSYGAGSGSGSRIVSYFFPFKGVVATEIKSVDLLGGGSAGASLCEINVDAGQVLNITVGSGGAAHSGVGAGGSGKVTIIYNIEGLTSLSAEEQFIDMFGDGESHKGKSVAFFINKHSHQNNASNFIQDIKNKSVLRENISIERRQIISSNSKTRQVTLSGEHFARHPSSFESDGKIRLYGACAAEKDYPLIEPRFSANLYLRDSVNSINILNMFGNLFRSRLCYTSGKISLQQDSKVLPIQLFNNTNVSSEGFMYSGSQKDQRFSVVKVLFNNKENEFQDEYVYEEDASAIQNIGIIETEINALSISSESEARRFAKWILMSAQYEQEVVKFTTGQEGAYAFPGAVIEIFDEMRSGNLRSGRILDIIENDSDNGSYFVIDKSILSEPLLGDIEFTVSTGADHTTIDKIESRAKNEKSTTDQDVEIDNVNSQQLLKFQARIIPNQDESKSNVIDMAVKMQFTISEHEKKSEQDVIKNTRIEKVFEVFYHGFEDGDKVRFASDGILPKGITPFEEYYIIDSTKHSFKVSKTQSGSAVKIFGQGKDKLFNVGGEHFVIPVDTEKTKEKIDQVMIGAIYSIRGDIGVIENNKQDISLTQLQNLGVSNSISDDWMSSSIFGQMKIVDQNWIYARNLGWIYIGDMIDKSGTPGEYFWFYTGAFGWVGTNEILKNTIWFIPSVKQNKDGASGFVNIKYSGFSGNISNMFVYYDSVDNVNQDDQTFNLGSSNKKLGRLCNVEFINTTGILGYMLNIADSIEPEVNLVASSHSELMSQDKYDEISIESSRIVDAGQALQEKQSVQLNIINNLEFDLTRNYNMFIDGVTGINSSLINKTWNFIFVNENTIELVDSEDIYTLNAGFNFDQANFYLVAEFDSDLKKFIEAKYFRILNNKEVAKGNYEITATEYAVDKFDAIDKKGVIRKPVVPIPPQEGMEVPDGPTNLVLKSSTI